MELEYDEKFQEMKKYIPFLENMIKRLESTSSGSSNPRQAQLDKIRSLRDLLLNKKKRMKMENLLKCEQVLVNLYAKVEQRDTLAEGKKVSAPDSTFSIDSPTLKEKSELQAVRNKLKSVTKTKDEDTLPEILSRNEIEEVETSGTKEPALFQRRPDKGKDEKDISSKRIYTRVLVSPETSSRRWSPSQSSPDKPLFSRRSPRRSPRRQSPYHKREKKKHSKESRKGKGLNITLNVPEDSLDSLNTKDLLTRILDCSDGDVDIDTLRELRKQILGELKKTGAKDDISDLILKSYTKKKENAIIKKTEEIEDGEISDSESEMIENVYGNLVIKEQNVSNRPKKTSKIQICLVINPEKDATNSLKDLGNDSGELEMHGDTNIKPNENSKIDMFAIDTEKESASLDSHASILVKSNDVPVVNQSTDNLKKRSSIEDNSNVNVIKECKDVPKDKNESEALSETGENLKEPSQFRANFYKPISEPDKTEIVNNSVTTLTNESVQNCVDLSSGINTDDNTGKPDSREIPLLNEPTVANAPEKTIVSEIDILQALKNEILSESINISGQEVETPLLHQPKVMKVASGQEILPKKRISIEKYKTKSANSPQIVFDDIMSPKDDGTKKPSLKLTEKECERFQIPKISFDDESLDEDDDNIEPSDVYNDLNPQSPDKDDTNIASSPPVIIPADPVKSIPAAQKDDIDMRKLPSLSPTLPKVGHVVSPAKPPVINNQKNESIPNKIKINRLVDPRVRRDMNPLNNIQSPNPLATNPDRTPRPLFTNMTPSPIRNPLMTPNNKSYEMPPSHQSLEMEGPSRKHVYVPSISMYDSRDRENSVSRDNAWESDSKDGMRNSFQNDHSRERRNTSDVYNKGSRNDRYGINKTDNYSYKRSECPTTPLPSFGRSEASLPNISYGKRMDTASSSFDWGDCPSTPIHPFGRSGCPSTPSHPFGRADCPPTPSHPFGRADCPPTPSHPFGRADCPPTPIHPFGRIDCLPTSSHSFDGSDCPSTPSHPFGRSDRPSTPIHPFENNLYSMSDGSSTPGRSVGSEYSASSVYTRREVPQPQNHQQSRDNRFNRSESQGAFHRGEYNSQKPTNDPRIHRKADYEYHSRYEEKDQNYYDRSYKYQKPYGELDNYPEQSDYKNKRNRINPHQRRRQYEESRHDSSVGPPGDGMHYRDRGRYNNEFGNEGGYHNDRQREKSIGRNTGPEDNVRSTYRARSIGRDPAIERETNSSVKLHTDRTFTIDTSVNTTFQKFLENKGISACDSSFNARMQRASSVGRSQLRESSVGSSRVRENSVGRTLLSDDKPISPDVPHKREDFQRAASVGRDLLELKQDKKSFQEIKADFKSYQSSSKDMNVVNVPKTNIKINENVGRTDRNKKDIQEKATVTSKQVYSPRKNYRDPRMRREPDRKKNYNYQDKKSGIVYSNDNIAKGAVLSTSFGVKNYKIPKIKRPVEEQPPEEPKKEDSTVTKEKPEKEKIVEKETEKKPLKSKQNPIDQIKISEKNKLKTKLKSNMNEKDVVKDGLKEKTNEAMSVTATETSEKLVDEIESPVERRLTRSSKKSSGDADLATELTFKPRKSKKPIIYDSDSDADSADDTNKDQSKSTSMATESTVTENPIDYNTACDELNNTDLESSFGLDDLELFTDQATSDPVIDSINALIADLDKDLHTTKDESSNNFARDMDIETILQNLTSPKQQNASRVPGIVPVPSVILQDILKEDVKDNVTNNENSKKQVQSSRKLEMQTTLTSTGNESTLCQNLKNTEDIVVSDTEQKKANNEIIDSTIITQKETHKIESEVPDEPIMDDCSTPDSTFNTDDIAEKPVTEKSVVDRTIESHVETNVSSTQSAESLPSSLRNEGAALDSIGSLLSILQDKTKIKELLSMLGDQSGENEKIKKKLEKLSEIVSDNEDDVQAEKTTTEHDDNVKVANNDVPNNNEQNMESKDVDIVMDIKVGDDQQAAVPNIIHDESKLETDLNDADESKLKTDLNDADESTEIAEITPPKAKKGPGKAKKLGKKFKTQPVKKVTKTIKRITRAAVKAAPTKPKQISRELLKLQEDIQEMYIRDDVLSATGIRMCRLAKLVDNKTSPKDSQKDDPPVEAEPVVVLEKHSFEKTPEVSDKLQKKKRGRKPKHQRTNVNLPTDNKELKSPSKIIQKPGPKSKTKNKRMSDPYAFETDSIGDTTTEKTSDGDSSSDSEESSSLASFKSFGSSERSTDTKKKIKRKKRGWQAGVIKPKNRKKKLDLKPPDATDPPTDIEEDQPLVKKYPIPDMKCFTDRTYCFSKNEVVYSCRLCVFTGKDIVPHYKHQHPHVEIPLSRMDPGSAELAIEQCKEINFQAISKISSDKYVCIFCFKVFPITQSVLETFFWHIVSMHTGEYKQLCSQCDDVSQCPFSLDIPPPPKDTKGQLIGYICKKCNFTQISLENLKTHVIVRHNDEQTAVYTINLAALTKSSLQYLLHLCSTVNEKDTKPVKKEIVEDSPSTSSALRTRKKSLLRTKITFENDDVAEQSAITSGPVENPIKLETVDQDKADEPIQDEHPIEKKTEVYKPEGDESNPVEDTSSQLPSFDICDYPHFKINVTESGIKEYICCINRQDSHFKTTLLISMKKHVQMKHSENWDGYCFVCKVIVTPQGNHKFKECFQHYLDKHIDDFPMIEKEIQMPVLETVAAPAEIEAPQEELPTKPYINVRPLSQLISSAAQEEIAPETSNFPVIQSVMSLGTPPVVEPPRASPTYPVMRPEKPAVEVTYKYEEVQAEVMSRKHRVVLETMICPDKLVRIYKCAGRFCSFTSDSAEDALLHASTHQRVGGMDALRCSYCDFDSAGNAIDLVMHVFKAHGKCQYSCAKCFYRAAASQSVGAHMSRVHNTVECTVLRTVTVSTAPVAEGCILTRDQAVPYYVCSHALGEDTCKFRTYTSDKFGEHLLQKHASSTSHPCYLCDNPSATAVELIQHMKQHGLKLYQCTWCVHGADSEAELLAHVSTRHPAKQPQAYLRIITNKDGSAERRVLPLAFLNKLKVPTEDVTPHPTREDPVREAERSIELETLIGHMLVEPTIEPREAEEKADSDVVSTDTLATLSVTNVIPSVVPSEGAVTDLPVVSATPSDTDAVLVKHEPPEVAQTSVDEVVVLDSDEETPDVPQVEEFDKTTRKVSLEELHKCPYCRVVVRTMTGLKRHVNHCVPQTSLLSCPHCSRPHPDRDALYIHYQRDHGAARKFECGACGATLSSLQVVRKHMRKQHAVEPGEVSLLPGGTNHYIVRPEALPPRAAPKRKSSSSSSEPPIPAKRHFFPHEVDQLPINSILERDVYCAACEFGTKVRVNMVRHLQRHAESAPVPSRAPVNPVPHLETNEKHFDKMLNLASSSHTPAVQPTPAPVVTSTLSRLPASASGRYPRQVVGPSRYTCCAVGCLYISVDDSTLRLHWDALHLGDTQFRCLHCPPQQHIDPSVRITSARVLSHLRMHDGNLYACSACSYYHFLAEMVQRHLSNVHQGAALMVVREDTPSVITPTAGAAPTMDLKAWRCGLCPYKNMLRGEVLEHCARYHNSKMQFRCAQCPYRASALDKVTGHVRNAHGVTTTPDDEVIHYYYREGELEEADLTPRWARQAQRLGVAGQPVKTEADPPSPPVPTPPPALSPPLVDLNLVKQEVPDVEQDSDSMEELCKKYGQFCDPNGIKFKCPLCNVVSESTKEDMESHLFEELKYRRWVCKQCSYKAFHKAGLLEHLSSEHRPHKITVNDINLQPTDMKIEKWVSGLLDHQANIIQTLKENFAKQKIVMDISKPSPSSETAPSLEAVEKYSVRCLKQAFGDFGAPRDKMYCCPKCSTLLADEGAMKDHLESELNKIRWCCSKCPNSFQTYHEAQFHCKVHDGQARPKEAVRHPAMRSAWITHIVDSQKKDLIQVTPIQTTSDLEKEDNGNNSLLVVRYEERVPTPDQHPAKLVPTPEQNTVKRKRASRDSDSDSDDPNYGKKRKQNKCKYCDYKCHNLFLLRLHVGKHFGIKPYACIACDFQGQAAMMRNHMEVCHPNVPAKLQHNTSIPGGENCTILQDGTISDSTGRVLCSECLKIFSAAESVSHVHGSDAPEFTAVGEVLLTCSFCGVLRLDLATIETHYDERHPRSMIEYVVTNTKAKSQFKCRICKKGFASTKDLKIHYSQMHDPSLDTTPSPVEGSVSNDSVSKNVSPLRRCAKKSTTKLPFNSVAKKSTTKLPFDFESDSEDEYSYYKTKPTPLSTYNNVTTLMPFCNTVMAFTPQKLSELIKIEPKVVVKDFKFP